VWQTYRKCYPTESHLRWTQKKWVGKPDKDLIGKNVIFYSIDTAVREISGRWGWDWGKERQTFQVSLIPHCQHFGTLEISLPFFEPPRTTTSPHHQHPSRHIWIHLSSFIWIMLHICLKEYTLQKNNWRDLIVKCCHFLSSLLCSARLHLFDRKIQ